MRKIVLTFGLIAGAILSAVMLATLPFHDQIGYDRGAVIGYTSMVLAFLLVYFGVRSYRDTVGGGTIAFGQALKVGLLIVLVATVCYVITWEVIYYGLAPEVGEEFSAYALEEARRSGLTGAELEARTQEIIAFKAQYDKPLVNIAYTFLEPLPVGLVLALVTAAITSRRPARPAAQA